MAIKGRKIKKTSTYRFNHIEETDDSYLNPEDGILQRVVIYDTQLDKPLKEIQYGSDGQAEQETIYEYDESGFLKREVLTDGHGETLEEKTFEADAAYRIHKAFQHYADGSYDVTTYTWDQNGRLLKKLCIDDEGEQESLTEYDYRDNLLVKETEYGEAEELLWEKSYQYIEGDLLEEMTHKDHAEQVETRKNYVYNEQGHLREVLTYVNDELTERVIFEADQAGKPLQIQEENKSKKNTLTLEYDDKGNIVFQTEHNMQGDMIHKVKRKYDADGHLLESKVTAFNPMLGINQHYIVQHVYEREEE